MNVHNNEYLQMGFPVMQQVESDYLTALWRITDCENSFLKKCQMYRQLENNTDLNSIYAFVEITGFIGLKDIINNCYLVSQLLVMDMQYLVFNEEIGAALACNDCNTLKKLIIYTKAGLQENNIFKIVDLQRGDLCYL